MKHQFINTKQLAPDEKETASQDKPVPQFIKIGGAGTQQPPAAPQPSLQMNAPLVAAGDQPATDENIAQMVKPKEETIEGIVTDISKEISRPSATGDRVFRMVSILKEDGTIVTRPVNKSFFDNNEDRLQVDAAVRCVFQETEAGRTQYVFRDRNNPQAQGVIKTHTTTTTALSNVTKLSATQASVLNSSITDERFFKRQERVADHLGKFEKNPGVLNALAMVYAGQKLV